MPPPPPTFVNLTYAPPPPPPPPPPPTHTHTHTHKMAAFRRRYFQKSFNQYKICILVKMLIRFSDAYMRHQGKLSFNLHSAPLRHKLSPSCTFSNTAVNISEYFKSRQILLEHASCFGQPILRLPLSLGLSLIECRRFFTLTADAHRTLICCYIIQIYIR